MATKSRLGKGLGALFPALPGETDNQLHGEAESSAFGNQYTDIQHNEHNDSGQSSSQHAQHENEAARDTNTSSTTEPHEPVAEHESAVSQGSGTGTSGGVDTRNGHVDDTANHRETDNQQGDDATAGVRTRSHDVSRETSNKCERVSRETRGKSSRRKSMPALNEIAHPSDLFFGSTLAAGGAAKKNNEDESLNTHSDVSRETSEADSSSEGLKPVAGGYLAELRLDQIGPNSHQPRTIFDEDELRELAESIKQVGVLQPVVVRRRPVQSKTQGASAIAAVTEKAHTTAVSIENTDQSARESAQSVKHATDATVSATQTEEAHTHSDASDTVTAASLNSEYELVMGERRWRASQLAGMETIPAIVKTTAEDDMLRDALLENLHRVALNPLEEAAAYQQMIDEFGLTQAELSQSISKSRPQIANTLRLLNLPASVQKKVASGVLSAGHARALLGLPNEEEMEKLANRIIAEGLSVRSTEEIVAMQTGELETQKKPKAKRVNPWSDSPIQQNLENRFDTKVSIKGTAKHGRIEIVFSSPEDMDRILALLMPETGEASSEWV